MFDSEEAGPNPLKLPSVKMLHFPISWEFNLSKNKPFLVLLPFVFLSEIEFLAFWIDYCFLTFDIFLVYLFICCLLVMSYD